MQNINNNVAEVVTVNMGPQHPSTHGVLRLVVDLDGETIVNVTPDVGYLHRGTEKLAENRTYHQFIPLTDRLDYLSPLSNNLAYCLAVEKFFGVKIPERADYMRVMYAELARIASHLVWIATHALDIGAMTVFLYAFRERERVLDMFECATGQRMTSSWIRIGGIREDAPEEFFKLAKSFVDEFDGFVDLYENLLTNNRIWKMRTIGIGVLNADDAQDYGTSGPLMRGAGLDFDLRRDEPYCCYDKFKFEVPTQPEGDTYARYKVRMKELREANKIVAQTLASLPEGPVMTDDPRVAMPSHEDVYERMESLIRRFYLISKGFRPPKGETYQGIEAPKGELGFYIVSEGEERPYRLKIRAPSYVNLGVLNHMAKGHMLADLVAIIGTNDVVLGEIDR
ncbi:MAG: NADH dehydrogenase (quinone) subunit D [Geovibrio sp.]|jgi:NADH-quinone oxidoreductase subunit D|uniref:NADH dehydrogenase (quinone) subunit D n=1 Tax=Geovibrio ferrireducens TaxID=46201 RepID=UPI00224686D6|nr:NADH dehydrogenase (quinone) subunit D [Geovibrio ferrireducens]MCD8491247.1 NADH dehydrogenase (quinone) subunit D [Geovibrio sp.]MCD8568271.1 NADH dehydrogenase (quinone) subunit D [Geovibrio sp.]